MDLGTDHTESFSAWINIMKTRFYSTYVSAELLIDSVICLLDYFIGIVYKATAETRSPSSRKTTAFTPPVHTLAIAGHLFMILICFGKVDMFRFSI